MYDQAGPGAACTRTCASRLHDLVVFVTFPSTLLGVCRCHLPLHCWMLSLVPVASFA